MAGPEISRRALLAGLGASVVAAKAAPVVDVAPAAQSVAVDLVASPVSYNFDVTRAVLRAWDGTTWRLVSTLEGIERGDIEISQGVLPCRRA